MIERLSEDTWIVVCPEQLGGLPTPRPPAWLEGGSGRDVPTGKARVLNAEGTDQTQAFLNGAETIVHLARRFKVDICYLKDRSPSCGVSTTAGRDGQVPGMGVLAALLKQEGFQVKEVKARSIDPPTD
jgi:uncharacterized protein YbbK (DUF523 family)